MIETNFITLRVVVWQLPGFVFGFEYFTAALPLLWRRRLARV
jgi:hypothetical protein